MADPLERRTSAEMGRSKRPTRSSLNTILIALAAGAGMFLAWRAAHALLLVFAGLLFGALLDACARELELVFPIDRRWRVVGVCTLFGIGATWLLVWSGTYLIAQADTLIQLTGEQLRVIRGELQEIGVAPAPSSEGPRTLAQLLFPDPGALFGTVHSAFNFMSSAVGNVVVIVFIGLFTAISPETYRRGILSLIPREHRLRVADVLDEMAAALRWWLIGQIVAVALIALTTWAALAFIGMPGALLLGLQAGLMNFIPYLGPVIAAGPIFLAAMAQGTTMVVWALGTHVIIQTVEGYVLAPLIQKRAVDVPPVLTLAAVVVFGALFGALGIALATPLVAALKIAVLRLYVEDRLGGETGT